MSYDGRALAKARQALREIKQRNEVEWKARRAEIFAREPELERLEGEIKQMMTEFAIAALKRGGDAAEAARQARDKTGALREQRAGLLRKHGLPEDYLDGIYSCPECSDTGYIEGNMCVCLEEAYRIEAARQLTFMLDTGNRSFANFDLSLYEPSDGSMSEGEVRRAMSAILDICRRYAEVFSEHTDNLLLHGGTGLGKTFMSACIAKVVSESGYSVVYDSCVSVLDAFESQKFDKNPENGAEISSQVRRYLGCDLLILDDLGTEMTTAFTQSALYTLINTRLINGKKTIISTNLTDDELTRRYSPQIVSRLRGEYRGLRFKGRDIREVKKKRGL